MKKSLLLTVAALTAVSMSAQTDVTPKNWKFSEMPVGSAESIFLPAGATQDFSISTPALTSAGGWYSGTEGGVALTNYIDGAKTVSDANKPTFEQYYKAASIVKGTENLLCIKGSGAPEVPYGTTAPSMQELTLWWISGENIALDKNYRFTMEYRFITNEDFNNGSFTGDNSMVLTFGNGVWMGTDNTQNYYQKSLAIQHAVGESGYWSTFTYDFKFVDTKAADQPAAPLIIKMWLGGSWGKDENGADVKYCISDHTVMLFRSFKLEQIDEIDSEFAQGKEGVNMNFKDGLDGDVSIEEINAQNDVIIATANGTINVIDANAPIEVYNIAGAKVATVAAPSAVEAIDLDMNGVFVVKVGDKVQKVIL